MKKIALVLFMVFILSGGGVASAQIINTATGLSATIKDNNQNQNTNVNTDVNTFVPTNLNSNIQGQQQGQFQGQQQGQGQFQGQNNDQVIAPKQTVLFKAPTQLPSVPSSSLPELNFGIGRMKDVTDGIPRIAAYGVTRLDIKRDTIMEVLEVKSAVKFKNLYKSVIDISRKLTGGGGKPANNVKYQVVAHESNKTLTIGAVVNGGGTGIASNGLGGGAGGGGIGPQWGRTSADDLFDIVFAKVSTE